MSNLPGELITEILLKLPVESLLQFKCVSKSWLLLISSPEFTKTHILLSASNKEYSHHRVMFGVKDCSLNALLYHPLTEAFDLDYPGKRPNGDPRLVGSVNGLICLAIRVFDGLCDLFLWNPSIRKYKKLPDVNINITNHHYLNKYVDFRFGFAYDEFQDDYKVVGIFPIYNIGRSSRVEVKIYSLKSDSWRCIDDYEGLELLHLSGKFVNGKLHWLGKCRKNIISIDLADEKWSEIEHPCYSKGYGFMALGVFGNDLSMFRAYAWTYLDVWVMKEYGIKESWTKMLTVKYADDSSRHMIYPPMLMSNEGEILHQFGSRFTKYNPKDDSIRYLDITNFSPCLEVEAEIYVKSLVCPFSQRDYECNNNNKGENNSNEDNLCD